MTKETTQKEWHYGECKHCWEIFMGQRKSKQYCSHSCRQKAYRKRKKEMPSIIVTIIKVEKKPSLRMKIAKLLHKFASLPF